MALLLALATMEKTAGKDRFQPADSEALLAAFVYNFCLFTTWPEEQSGRDQPFVIAIAGLLPEAFAPLAERQVGKRPIRIVHWQQGEALPEPCHALLVHGAGNARRDAILAQVAQLPILTLSPDQGFCQAGGIVEFFLSEQRMRFRISLAHLARANLRIESRLLKLAVLHPAQAEED